MALITTAGRQELIALHVAMFNAAPSASRLSSMVQAVEGGQTLFQVGRAMAADSFFGQVYPGLMTGSEFANKLADILLTTGTLASARTWAVNWATAQLTAGTPRADIIVAAVQALRANTNVDFDAAETKLTNTTSVAEYYAVTKLQNGTTLQDLQDVILGVTEVATTVTAAKAIIDGEAAAATGKTFSLSIGEDSGTSFLGTTGNDIYEASIKQDNTASPVNSLENFDSLDGGAGTDTLKATLNAAGAAPVLKNIENIEARFTTAENLSLTNTTGVSSVTIAESTAAGTVSGLVKIASLAVRDQKQNSTFTGNTAEVVALSVTNVGDTASGGAANSVTADDVIKTLNVTTNNSNVTTGTIAKVETLTVAATGSNTFDVTSTAATVKTATITGTGTVSLGGTTLAALETLTATDSGGVTAKVDDTAVKVTTGGGKDSITYVATGLAATAVVDLGAGNDTLTIGAAATAGAKANGGAGTDTLVVTNGTTMLTAGADKIYSGFETLGINGGQGNYDMDNLPGLTAVSLATTKLAADAFILNAAAGTTVTIASKAGTDLATTNDLEYSLKDASGTSDAVTLNVNAADSTTTLNGTSEGDVTVASFIANDIETFNVVSKISNIDPLLTAADYLNTITVLEGDALATLNISGNGNLDITTLTAGALTKINASTFTGDLVVDASGAGQSVEFLGGTGDDTYTATVDGDTINAGKGADMITLDGGWVATDTLIFAAGDSTKDDADEITNFGTPAGGGALDLIDLGAFGFTGSAQSALANKGALPGTIDDDLEAGITDFFASGGFDRAVAIGTDGADTIVFVDVNKDGNFSEANDLVIVLIGVSDVALGNFGF